MTAMLFAVWIVAFIVLKDYGTHRAFASSSFFICLITIFLFTIGLVSNIVLIVSITMAIVGIIWIWVAEKQDY